MAHHYEVTRTYWFSAAHRIPDHPKCTRLHGHNYKVEVTLSAGLPGDLGMVMDFGKMDKIIDPIIDKLDHRYLLPTTEQDRWLPSSLPDDWICKLPTPTSTVEDLVRWIYDLLEGKFGSVHLKEITLWENHKSRATYRR